MRLPFILQVTGAPFLYFSESSSIFELLFRRWCCFLSFLHFDDKKLPFPFMLITTFIVFLMCVQSLSHVWLFVTLWTVAYQALPSMGLSSNWSGLLFPSPGDLPNPGIEPCSPALEADAFNLWVTRKIHIPTCSQIWLSCLF